MNGSLAFTWSPDPKVISPYVDPEKQYDACFSFLILLSKCSRFVIYSELNLSGNIHFHAIISLHDKVKWYKKVLPTFKRNGFVVLKHNVNEQWHKYISKDSIMMKEILGEKYRMYNNEEYFRSHQEAIGM